VIEITRQTKQAKRSRLVRGKRLWECPFCGALAGKTCKECGATRVKKNGA